MAATDLKTARDLACEGEQISSSTLLLLLALINFSSLTLFLTSLKAQVQAAESEKEVIQKQLNDMYAQAKNTEILNANILSSNQKLKKDI